MHVCVCLQHYSLNIPYQCTKPVILLQTCKIHSQHCSNRCNICIVEKSEEPVKGVQG